MFAGLNAYMQLLHLHHALAQSSNVFSDVDLWWLTQIELLIRGLLHQVEQSVLQHELHEVNEWLLEEHSLLE